MRHLTIAITLILSFGVLHAQHPGQPLSVTSFEMEEDHLSYRFSDRGIFIEVEIKFGSVIEDFFQQSHQLTWELRDARNVTVYHSESAESSSEQKDYVNARKPMHDREADYMTAEGEIFIPYKKLKLKPGAHEFTLGLHLKNKVYSKRNFHEQKITINIPDIQYIPFQEQNFEVFNLYSDAPALNKSKTTQGWELSFKLRFLQDPKLTEDAVYEISYGIRDVRRNKIIMEEWVNDYPVSSGKLKESDLSKKPSNTWETPKIEEMIDFKDFPDKGISEFELRIMVGVPGKPAKIVHSEIKEIEIPKPVYYQDVEFDVSDIKLSEGSQSGTKGIVLSCSVSLKNPYYQETADGDDTFYFFSTAYLGEKMVSPWLKKSFDRRNFNIAQKRLWHPGGRKHKLRLFIPYYDLDVPDGTSTLMVTIGATHPYGKHTFTNLDFGEITVNVPERKHARVSISNLSIKDKIYDFHVKPLGEGKPDPYYHIKVGSDIQFTSEYHSNTFTMDNATFTLRYLEGDKISMEMWDSDTFKNDDMGEMEFKYQGKQGGFSVNGTSFGDVKTMNYSFTPVRR